MEWDVAISWQLRALRGGYGLYEEVRGSMRSSIGSFHRATQRAVRRRMQQPWRYCILRPVVTYKRLSTYMSGAAQPSMVCVHAMHEWIPSPGKVSDWLIPQLRQTSRTTLISAITVLASKGTHGFKLVTMQLPKFAHDTHNLMSALPLRKLPIMWCTWLLRGERGNLTVRAT